MELLDVPVKELLGKSQEEFMEKTLMEILKEPRKERTTELIP